MPRKKLKNPFDPDDMKKTHIVGITFGVFDLFHEGHKNLLYACQRNCHFLYVGLYTDYWVRIQKGHNRPYESYELREQKLREYLEFMGRDDYKIIQMDTLDVTEHLKFADVFFLGEEQKNMRWSGAPYIVRVPYTDGISTSIIAKRRKR